ncbi:MAG: hypothetical protein PF693_05810 [Spirochaetia bacterium]|nr:hypothetical protein [Spirochaetia bacterium]
MIQKLTQNGDLVLSVGDYTVKLSGDNYETEEVSIAIQKGENSFLNSVLKHDREFVLKGFTESIRYYSELISGSAPVTTENIKGLLDLQKEHKLLVYLTSILNLLADTGFRLL